MEKRMTVPSLSTGRAKPSTRRRPAYGRDIQAPSIPYLRIILTMAVVPALIVFYLIWRAVSADRLRAPPLPHWPNFALISHAPLVIQIHLLTIAGALAVGGVLMSGVKGTT
jgi:hypothetical protein